MRKLIRLFFILSFILAFGCSGSKPQENTKSGKEEDLAGELNISVDESILPLIQEQVSVFETSFPNTKIALHAAPEVKAINLLLTDKAQIALLTRELSIEENKYFAQRSINPRIFKIGYDGIILVNNVASVDTSIKVSKIIDLLKGNHNDANKLIFDDLNSSALRYLKELGLVDKISSSNLMIEKDVKNMLDKVANNASVLGVMTLNQYLNVKQTFGENDKIRILSIQNDLGSSKDRLYYKPSQSTLATETYPLRRPIYILNYHPNMVLGIGFSSFLTGDRGQRIVLKSGLLPETMPGREIIIRDKIN